VVPLALFEKWEPSFDVPLLTDRFPPEFPLVWLEEGAGGLLMYPFALL
jgi:hypothetical protein